MISATRRWLRRNRNNFAIGVGVLGVGYIAGQYVLSKVSEAKERMTNDRIAKENLRRRFQQNQEDCTFTVLALLPTATDNIIEALPVETITHDLQQKKAERLGKSAGTSSEMSSGPPSVTDEDGKSLASFQSDSYVHASQMAASSSGSRESAPPKPLKTKAQLWSDLKINSITRSFTLLYTLSLLTLLTRIQLNLLGRRNYLSSVVSLASHPLQDSTISLENHDDDNDEQTYGNDFETNRKFLTFSWWLIHRGWRKIMEKVEPAVKEVFGPLNPREDVSLERLSSLILDVRRRVEGTTREERKNTKWLPYLLPPPDQEDFVLRESGMTTPPPPSQSPPATTPSPPTLQNPPIAPPTSQVTISPALRHLLNETSDLIDSPPFSQTLTLLLDTTFSHLTDRVLREQAFKLPPSLPSSVSGVEETGETKTKLANILAVVTRQAHAIGNGVPNEYVQAMEGVGELEAFSAVVFSSFFEAVGGDGEGKEDEVKGVERLEDEVRKEDAAEASGGLLGGVRQGFESVWGRVVGR